MNTVLIGVLIGLVALAIILLLSNSLLKNPTSAKTETVSTPATNSPPPPPTPCRPQASGGAGKLKSFLGGLIAIVVTTAIITAIVYGLIYVKGCVDSNTHQSRNTEDEELVTIEPGLSKTVYLNGSDHWDLDPPQPTVVEYLNFNGEPTIVSCGGRLISYIVSSPGVNYPVESYEEPVKAIRLTAANPNSGEYQFVVQKR